MSADFIGVSNGMTANANAFRKVGAIESRPPGYKCSMMNYSSNIFQMVNIVPTAGTKPQ